MDMEMSCRVSPMMLLSLLEVYFEQFGIILSRDRLWPGSNIDKEAARVEELIVTKI